MQAYYELETNIPSNHQLHIQVPNNIPAGRAKIAIIYELTEVTSHADASLDVFLQKYQSQDIDIDTCIFDENRKNDLDRDFRL